MDAPVETAEEVRAAHKRTFLDFLEQDHGHGLYATRVKDMVEKERTRLLVDLGDMRKFDAETARRCVPSGPCAAPPSGAGWARSSQPNPTHARARAHAQFDEEPHRVHTCV